jgi:hypothetical protein
MQKLPYGQKNKLLQKAFVLVDVVLNRIITSSHALGQILHKRKQTLNQV